MLSGEQTLTPYLWSCEMVSGEYSGLIDLIE